MSPAKSSPVVVLVTGAPGSGKTTLARGISDGLALPHLNKDLLRDGKRFTLGAGGTDEGLVWESLYDTIRQWLRSDTSFVVDFTTYRGKTEHHVLAAVGTAVLLNVHCRAEHALDRFTNRLPSHPQLSLEPGRIAAQRDRASKDSRLTQPAPALGCPTIEVDTDNGYRPGLAQIIDWILERSGRQIPLTP